MRSYSGPAKVKVVILCGGRGTRLHEETEYRPKPMVSIGGKPILWHIMKTYSHFGFNDFVLCLGYKGWMIKEYFMNYRTMTGDFTLRLGDQPSMELHTPTDVEGWRVTMVETGESTMTGGRLRRAAPYLTGDHFMLTYGDGVGAIDIGKLFEFHKSHGKMATVTGVYPPGRYGELEARSRAVKRFAEKPHATGGRINGGFLVFNRKFIDKYLTADPGIILEQKPLSKLARDGQMMMYAHNGFWQSMDTFREMTLLQDLWDSGRAPWKVWK